MPPKEIDVFRELPAHTKSNRLLFTSSAPSDPIPQPVTFDSLPSLLLPSIQSSAATYATKLHAKSIPLVNPQRLSAAATKKQAGQARRKQDGIRAGTIGLLSRKEAKRKSVWVPKPRECRFELFTGLRTVWEEYMVQLLGMGGTKPNVKTGLGGKWAGNAEALQNKIAKAEFTGCFLTVKVSSNKDLVGVEGIVIHETENTFKIITPKDKLKVVPKRNGIFTFRISLPPATIVIDTLQSAPSAVSASPLPIPPSPSLSPASASASTSTSTSPMPPIQLEFDIYGSQFCFRSGDRAGRKFKSYAGIEIDTAWLGGS